MRDRTGAARGNPPAALRVVRLLLTVSFLLLAGPAVFGGNQAQNEPLYDVVAVGRGRGQILLATLGSPPQKLQWRFRKISVPAGQTVSSVVLSLDGTKALVVFGGGASRILDLTKPITAINAEEIPAPQHRLPQARFPRAANGEVCLLDDAGVSLPESCTWATTAAVHEDGRVLYAKDDGQLVVAPAAGLGAGVETLAYRLPVGASYELLAGHRGDARDFLLLVTRPATQRQTAAASSSTVIVDPRSSADPLGQYADPKVAALRALLAFSGARSDPSPATGGVLEDDATLKELASRLDQQMGADKDQQSPAGSFSWSFFRVAANPSLYAPVLEFADGEPDYPSNADLWEEIKASAPGSNSIEGYRKAYAAMGDRRWSRCTYYVRTRSYPGTWLIEYWFYYPFDEGKAHPHIHDSEHLFVEVDKLGGTVRNVLASDHDSFVPNNLYSTLVKKAPPVALPLFAMVELGKHAMAPDLDHDGHFVRGVDDNVHIEPYAFWGLRDKSTKFHFMMEPYLSSMSLPRHRDGRFALADAAVLFPGLDVPAEHLVCVLQPLPDDPPCAHCEAATADAAIARLVDHPDAQNPQAIYKPFVVPWHEIRVGVGIFDWSEGRAELSLAYVGDFRHMTAGLLPIPARLSLEYGWVPLGRDISIPFNGQRQFIFSRTTMFAGVRVERLITNTQGFYFAATPKFADISERAAGGIVSPAPLHWQYGGVSYHLGYVLELPSAHKGNLVQQIGALIGSSPQFPVLLEWRVSLGFLRQRGRHDFGARPADRNPYE
jgi:hypothetical protein